MEVTQFRQKWRRTPFSEKRFIGVHLSWPLYKIIRDSSRRNQRSLAEEVRSALEWYYLKMWETK